MKILLLHAALPVFSHTKQPLEQDDIDMPAGALHRFFK